MKFNWPGERVALKVAETQNISRRERAQQVPVVAGTAVAAAAAAESQSALAKLAGKMETKVEKSIVLRCCCVTFTFAVLVACVCSAPERQTNEILQDKNDEANKLAIKVSLSRPLLAESRRRLLNSIAVVTFRGSLWQRCKGPPSLRRPTKRIVRVGFGSAENLIELSGGNANAARPSGRLAPSIRQKQQKISVVLVVVVRVVILASLLALGDKPNLIFGSKSWPIYFFELLINHTKDQLLYEARGRQLWSF